MPPACSYGTVFAAGRAPEALVEHARAAEEAGFAECWVTEDCFHHGGISQAAVALAATTRLRVGLGILPAVFRNPVATAMEIATLARLYPGRVLAGLGHGVPSWIDQIGALPRKPLTALVEHATAVSDLLRGATVSTAGEYVRLREAALLYPPASPPPLALGVRRARGLRAAGRIADGAILAEPVPPAYVAWARERMREGAEDAGRACSHRVTAFVTISVNDRARARRWAAACLTDPALSVHLAPLDRDAELHALRALPTEQARADSMADDLVDLLCPSGTPAEVAALLARIGADALALSPLGPDPDHQLRLTMKAAATASTPPSTSASPPTY
jgi:alkanesulfonate monooxygenase SsuD/methylene tetrahydromethanopterin reductase-like flavin-dependent oxidoreductase (luciferase family)